ncbi:MAG TPA: acyl-CoA synthetase [Candidatus Limnocylindrales bacterium]|nr:acyl-CoA synthetase [Candidatus Limnocylindrales bacterium]
MSEEQKQPMELNIADLFELVADTVPDREALICGTRRFTYAELDREANRLAHFLADRGVKAGEHVGMYLYNGHEYLVAMLAAFKIRAVPVNVNYRYVEDELQYLLNDSDLVALFYQRELADRLAAVRANAPKMRVLVEVDDTSAPRELLAGATRYDDAVASSRPERGFEPRSGKDIYIIYTGGTTGMPKGVMWRHEDVLYAGLQGGNPGGPPIERGEQLAEIVHSGMCLTFLPAAPLIHGAAEWASIIAFFGGGKCILQRGKSFDPKIVARLIRDEKVNTVTLVGDAMARPLAEAITALGDEADMSSVFVIGSAGAVLSEAVKEQLRAAIPSTMIVDSFGATETGHQGSMAPGTGHGAGQGPLFYMNETNCVLDDDRKPVAPGSGVVGKLARRGHIPVGYYNDPVKTAATFFEIDGVRWVMPGDLATVEADGSIRVFGRGSVCINSGGEKIFPEEVEAALKAHDAVLDAVVVGIPDERWGQRVAALVQLRPGAGASAEDLERHCRTKVAGYKVPRVVRFVERVERQPSGKPDYRWAASYAAAQASGAAS